MLSDLKKSTNFVPKKIYSESLLNVKHNRTEISNIRILRILNFEINLNKKEIQLRLYSGTGY